MKEAKSVTALPKGNSKGGKINSPAHSDVTGNKAPGSKIQPWGGKRSAGSNR